MTPDTPPSSPPRPPRPLWLAGLVGLVWLTTGLSACGDDARSTAAAYRLVIEPCQGSLAHRSSAAAIGPNLLVTVAHGFEAARDVEVTDADGQSQGATVVHLDPTKDIAVLATDEPLADHLDLAPPEEGQGVTILTYGEVDGPRLELGEVIELVEVTLDGEGRRDGIRLAASIEPGDSGAAVINDDGRMVGMVFASARNAETGWAVSSTEVVAALAELEGRGTTEALPAC